METTDQRGKQWGRLLFEVHIKVYENHTALNKWTPGNAVDVDNPAEIAAVMARAREAQAAVKFRQVLACFCGCDCCATRWRRLRVSVSLAADLFGVNSWQQDSLKVVTQIRGAVRVATRPRTRLSAPPRSRARSSMAGPRRR